MGNWEPYRPPRSEVEPTRLGPSLDRLSRRFGLAPPELLGAVFTRWEELVGPDVAAHARPLGLRDGVLTVEVDHPAWASSLQLLSGDLLARVRESTDLDVVHQLAVRVRPQAGRRRREDRR